MNERSPSTEAPTGSETVTYPRPFKPRRRVLRVLLSLLTPGLGHAAIGHWKRGALWFAVHLTAIATTYSLGVVGMPRLMWAAIGGVLLLQFFVVPRDATKLQPSRMPKLRYLTLLVVGVVWSVNLMLAGARTKLLEAFQMPSAAMYPTILVGDHVMTSKFPLTFERGDVVVFRYPEDPKITYLKRVVAVGGDTIELRASQLIINGSAVPAAPTDAACSASPAKRSCTLWRETLGGHSYLVARDLNENYGPRRVQSSSYFMLGDNRDNSNDSRVWGPVPEALMVGKVKFIHWSSGEDGIRWARVNTVVE